MADFDNFESASGQQEEDPAAEFLAREQNQMAGLEDDFGTAQPAPAAGKLKFCRNVSPDSLKFKPSVQKYSDIDNN